MEQLLSLLKPLWLISKSTQIQSRPYGYRYLQKIITERLTGCLNVDYPLQHYSDEDVTITELSPRVIFTRKLLVDAVDVKFFSRFFRKKDKSVELKQDLILECQHLLHPALRQIDNVNDVIVALVNSESLAIGGQWCKSTKKACQKAATKSKERKGVDIIYSQLWTNAKQKLIAETQKKFLKPPESSF